jgi:predicted type IV restriction endonuclease
MSVPERVVDLVERFEVDRKTYRSTAYKEEWIRQDFIDPLFEALGWDVANRKGVPVGPQREVVPEDRIKVSRATKAPDYAFRVHGTRKFFVEAKKPSVNLEGDISPAFQVRRYAWSAKLSLSLDPHRLRGVRHLRLPLRTQEAGRPGDRPARLHDLRGVPG